MLANPAEAQAVLESVIRDANLNAENTAMRHGLKIPPAVTIKPVQLIKVVEVEKIVKVEKPVAVTQKPVAPDPTHSPNIIQPLVSAGKKEISSWVKGALGAGAILGASAIGYGLSGGFTPNTPPEVSKPTEPLLKWLRGRGDNLPPSGLRNGN